MIHVGAHSGVLNAVPDGDRVIFLIFVLVQLDVQSSDRRGSRILL